MFSTVQISNQTSKCNMNGKYDVFLSLDNCVMCMLNLTCVVFSTFSAESTVM